MLAIVSGVLAFGVRPTSDSVLVDTLFLAASIGFIASAVSELFEKIRTLSDASKRPRLDRSSSSDER
ncbi:MAG: hypothetical protein RLN60_03895 [Phycisphaerales bacterium]